jgi:hypothetical protein
VITANKVDKYLFAMKQNQPASPAMA